MFSQGDIQAVFNPPLTVESRIRQAIPTLFEDEPEEEDSRFYPYRWDFLGYCRDILGSTPWAMQQEIAEAYILALRQQHERIDYENGELVLDDLEYWQPGQVIQNWIGIDAGHASGKCIAASEYITLANGCRVKAGQLIGHQFDLLTLKNNQIVSVKAKAEFNTIESVYRITTSTGKEIVRNFKHPLWVADGVFGWGKRPKITSIGWKALGEIKHGQLVAMAETLPAFGQESTLSDDELKILAYLIGDGGYTRNDVIFSQQENKQLVELSYCVNQIGCTIKYVSQYDYRITGPGKGYKNPVIELLRAHGLMGKHSRDKFIPSEIFVQPKEKIALFLSRLFATDGWVSLSRSGSREIGFCSASETLVRDIQELLVRFGIHCKVFPKRKVNAWILAINTAEIIIDFCEQITIYGKEEAQDKVYQACLSIAQRRIQAVRNRPDRPPWRYKNCLLGTIWEKVISVERIGIEPTVAIEVPEHHTYLTMFYEHNTWLLAKFVSHFFDCFSPSITYCFAPTSEQINDLLFKEIRVDRGDRDLPGFVFPRDTRIKYRADHFVTGRATNNANSMGTERTHGQHGKFLLFVIDESEGIPDFIWDAIRSMASGGIVIVIFARNPRTTTCRAHQLRSAPRTKAFRISCLDVPNVVENREVIPNLARRDYILDMLGDYAKEVDQHNPDDYTFELSWKPGIIYKPQQEFCWRVLGIAEENEALNTFCPYGRYDAAVERGKASEFVFTDEHEQATIGVDAARFGDDFGTVWIRRGDWLWRSGNFQSSDSFTFYNHIKGEMRKLVDGGVVEIEVRIDAGGGWGAGTVDLFNYDLDLKYRGNTTDLEQLKAYATTGEQRNQIQQRIDEGEGEWAGLLEFRVYEVNFDGVPSKPKDFYNLVTEMYYYLGESMRVLYLRDAPKALKEDLCKREYDYGMKSGRMVKVLTPKHRFKAAYQRSPDDGDGAALAAAPKQMFKTKTLLLHAG